MVRGSELAKPLASTPLGRSKRLAMDQAREEEDSVQLGADGDETRLPPSPRDGWEAVAAPPLLQASEEPSRGWEIVAVGRGVSASDDGCSIFPPRDHEGLHVEQGFMASPEGGSAAGGMGSGSVPMPAPSSSSSSTSPSSASFSSLGDGGESWRPDRQLRHARERKPFMELARRVVRSGYERLYFKLPLPGVRERSGGMKQGAAWSLAAVAGLAAVLLYVRRRYQREKLRLLLLIQEKDQKISQLLLQIAQMNEAMSSHQRVPVLRSA